MTIQPEVVVPGEVKRLILWR